MIIICVVGYCISSAILAGIFFALYPDDDDFVIVAAFWPLVVVAIPFMAIAKLVEWFTKKMINKNKNHE